MTCYHYRKTDLKGVYRWCPDCGAYREYDTEKDIWKRWKIPENEQALRDINHKPRKKKLINGGMQLVLDFDSPGKKTGLTGWAEK